jgi:hypothetical protein
VCGVVVFVKLFPNVVDEWKKKGYTLVCHQKTQAHTFLKVVEKFDS